MMIYAVNDIKKGEEITLFYHCPIDAFSKREEHFRIYGFKCDCKLCELERKDPKQEERAALVDQCCKYVGILLMDPDKIIREVTPIIKKVRLPFLRIFSPILSFCYLCLLLGLSVRGLSRPNLAKC